MDGGLSGWGVTVGTIILAVATIWLTMEVRSTRIAEAEWRERDGVVRGVKPYLGKYAEPGKLDLHEGTGMNLDYYGTKLEVNWHGAILRSDKIGYYYGGLLEIHDEEMIMEMGLIPGEDENQVKIGIATLSKNPSYAHHRQIAITTGGGSEWSEAGRHLYTAEWRLDLKVWENEEWKVIESVGLERYAEGSPRTFFRTSGGRGTTIK